LGNAQGAVNFAQNVITANGPAQQVMGFGFSDAFGQANSLFSTTAANQTAIENLFFSTQTGAGFSILRLGIITDTNIEPTAPASGPTGTPTYTFDGKDGGQVQLAEIGQHYGLHTFYADAWSAPAYMKTNNSTINGGQICGSPGAAACAHSYDWRAAYANYLLQYVKFYAGVGIPIQNLGFINEPDLSESYASMDPTTAQAVDFIDHALGPAVHSSGLGLTIFCCDGSKYSSAAPYASAIQADPTASSYVGVISAHEYGGHFTQPMPTNGQPVWMTEWSSGNSTANSSWDCNNCSGGPDGMYLANDVIQAFNAGQINAYVYWYGNSTSTAAPLIITSSKSYTVEGKFYALAALSRFVRPGAYVVSTTNPYATANLVAFRNTDGSKVMDILNTGTTSLAATFTVDPGTSNSAVKTYLTGANGAYNVVPTETITETDTAMVSGSSLFVTVPARSLVTLTMPPSTVKGTIELVATPTLQLLGDGTYQQTVTIANIGTGTVTNLQMTNATLGSVSGVPAPGLALPVTVGSIAPGGSLTVYFNYPKSAGTPGSAAAEKLSGTYNGGTFNASFRATLP
jgi:glucosylceramidase